MEENELAKYPGLYQRGGVWYVRKKVPIDLRHLNNSDQVRRSLDVSDFKAAVRLYPAKMAEITHRLMPRSVIRRLVREGVVEYIRLVRREGRTGGKRYRLAPRFAGVVAMLHSSPGPNASDAEFD